MKSFLTKLQSYKNLFKLSLKGIKKSASIAEALFR